MANELVIAADFGTSSVKVAAINADLQIQASVTEHYPLFLSNPNAAEQRPEDWWEALRRATAALSKQVPNLKQKAGAIVFAAQMCGVVPVDEAGNVLRPCLVCVDKRSASISRSLIGGFPSIEGYRVDKLIKWLRLANGAPGKNGMDPPGKMLWIKQHEPEIYAKTAKFLDVKDWLILRSTGEMTMTADSANLTWMMNTQSGKEGWSDTLIRQCGLDRDKLPNIVDGGDIVGTLTARAAEYLGLKPETLMLGGGSDVSLSAIGAGLVDDGELMICASTSCWISGFFDRRIVNVSDSYATITSSVKYRPLLVASQESAGSAADWAACAFSETQHTRREGYSAFFAETGPVCADDPFFLPWMAGEKVPVDDDRLRGAFYGLSLRHDRNSIRRAVLDGVAMNTAWAFSRIARLKSVKTSGPIALVGGMGSYPAFVQNLANHLNRPIVTGNPRFAGVMGAAALAAPALDWTSSVWDGANILRGQLDTLVDPDPLQVEASLSRQAKLQKARKHIIKIYQST